VRFSFEQRLWNKGIEHIAGIDEAGRGPLAGPVVAAAVILPSRAKLKGLADSKLLSAKKREEIFSEIKKQALAIGIGRVSHRLVDKLNIGRANLLAMKLAVVNLSLAPDYLLIDGGRYRIDLPVQQRGIMGGDRRCASIAAASIVAKVTRDRIMLRYHAKYPEYHFHLHKGYGTEKHFQKLRRFGPCPIHRRSFVPISTMTANPA
jgi:ribonuclease HII